MGSGDILSRQFSQSLFRIMRPMGLPMRPAPADAGIYLDRVLFDLHAAAAAVSDLPSGKVAVYIGNADQEARRHPLDDPHKQLTVGLSGC